MRVNESLILSVFYQPGTSHISGIEQRAEQALELGMISALPTIEVKESKVKPFWSIIVTCKTEDRPFWFGYYLGKDWCVNNRPLTVGEPTAAQKNNN